MQIVALRFEEPLILRVARLIHEASGVGWPPIAEIQNEGRKSVSRVDQGVPTAYWEEASTTPLQQAIGRP